VRVRVRVRERYAYVRTYVDATLFAMRRQPITNEHSTPGSN